MVTAIHQGSYATLEQTYMAIATYAREQNITIITSDMFECYLNQPQDTPEADLQTAVYYAIDERQQVASHDPSTRAGLTAN
jgi:effector-binding domain-containing protein